MQIGGYLYLRRKFQPRSVKLAIVAKFSPASGVKSLTHRLGS